MGIEPKDYDHGRFYSSQPMPLIGVDEFLRWNSSQ